VLDTPLVASAGRPLLVLDLAMPRDVAPEVADLAGITLVDLERLSSGTNATLDGEAKAAEEIVAAELEAFLAWMRGADVAPTVAALRAKADEVVGTELRRLAQRCPELSDEHRAEVAHTLHRVVQRLLHQPTVRVRQLAAEPGGEAYAEALRELFDLRVPAEIDPTAANEVRP
jgi:glutamyl-tRNA reductase